MQEVSIKRQRTAKVILHAVKVLYEKKGLGQISYDEVAREAGVCRTTVFNYFPTTQQLLAALQTLEVEEILSECEREDAPTGYKRIEALFYKLIDDTAKYPNMMTTLTNNLILSEDSPCIEKLEQLVAASLREAGWCPDREISYEHMAIMLMGQYYGLMNHYHIVKAAFESDKIKKEIKAMIEYLLDTGSDYKQIDKKSI
ncbi:MAG: TetR/AcrR family transcriptional regulator [Lachnospiraceae bacterium]